MKETFYAGVYWPARKESAEECARRAELFIHLLAPCDPIYARWFEQANSLKKALQLQFEPTYETFLRFFKSKKYNEGSFGFSFSAWTGHKEDGHGGVVMLSCGSAVAPPPNSCLLELPHAGPEEQRVLTAPVLTGVLRALVLAWEPDWGGVISERYRDLRDEPVGPPYTGWLMYLSRRRGEVPPLPAPVRVEPVEDKGSLVILTPERFTVDDPAHVALADEVRALLDRAGLLKESSAYSSTPS
ncbi:immunity 52 family protein [Archangium violaceum]|uniref:immunity 52 family protein n=1 Tax=Archangium violaceum TaxID=83451 RepID=UPI00194DB950|nr:immunity 52 family protein [Archangium violaceum]QRN96273.1 immunity 52 family protein [Archangium violaceum]